MSPSRWAADAVTVSLPRTCRDEPDTINVKIPGRLSAPHLRGCGRRGLTRGECASAHTCWRGCNCRIFLYGNGDLNVKENNHGDGGRESDRNRAQGG